MMERKILHPHLDVEHSYAGRVVCGVDEAGRGPWAGPVVAAAVILDMQEIPEGIHDSKKLNAKKREALYERIMATSQAYAIAQASVAEIDTLNILHATMLAMQRAVMALELRPQVALIDGNRAPALAGIHAHTIVKGDALSLSIAAASILAKVHRDHIMHELDGVYPMYGFAAHAGYGTAQHQDALQRYGVTVHHRRSYAPVKALLQGAA
jgi:ribonuclease HII